jgi:hypothetical protein
MPINVGIATLVKILSSVASVKAKIYMTMSTAKYKNIAACFSLLKSSPLARTPKLITRNIILSPNKYKLSARKKSRKPQIIITMPKIFAGLFFLL